LRNHGGASAETENRLSDGAEHKSQFSDDTLGMNRKIDRRDFIYGAGIGLAASLIPGAAHGMMAEPQAKPEAAAAQNPYPPQRIGMRGDHPGSFEAAHQMRDQRSWNLAGVLNPDEPYDLIVVGGGISGLSANAMSLSTTAAPWQSMAAH
jgi:spermidine dehydrogenase